MSDAVIYSPKQRGRPFKAGVSGNPRGRPKGARNRRSLANIEAAQAGGLLPLDFMLALMRDETQPPERRLEAARAAAPYVHPRLATAECSDVVVPIVVQISADEALV